MLPQTAEAWMNAGSQALLIGNALKKPSELFTFLIGQGRTERFVMFVANPADVTQGCLSLGGQVKRVGTAVVRAILSLYKPAFLQLVDDRYQGARVHLESYS